MRIGYFSRASLVRVLLFFGANENAVRHHTPLPRAPVWQARMHRLFGECCAGTADDTTALQCLLERMRLQQQQNAPWWQFWKWCCATLAHEVVLCYTAQHDGSASERVVVTPLLRAVANKAVSPGIVHLLIDQGKHSDVQKSDGI